MNSEDRFWLGFWSLCAIVIATVAINASLYYRSENQVILEMVQAGADPIAATCSINDPQGISSVCAVLVAKR